MEISLLVSYDILNKCWKKTWINIVFERNLFLLLIFCLYLLYTSEYQIDHTNLKICKKKNVYVKISNLFYYECKPKHVSCIRFFKVWTLINHYHIIHFNIYIYIFYHSLFTVETEEEEEVEEKGKNEQNVVY